MKNKINFFLIVICCAICATGCDFNKKYNDQVTAIVNNEADSFEQSVKEVELENYYKKSNQLGFNLYNENNKLFSPLIFSNNIIDLSYVFDEEYSNNLENLMPRFYSYLDAKEFSKTLIPELKSTRTIWLDEDFAKEYYLSSQGLVDFKDFDFYLVHNKESSRSEIINKFVKEKIGLKDFTIDTNEDNICELIDINILESKILLNANSIEENKDKIVAKDIICKCIENPDFKAIELPIKSNNKNLVIDFICIKDKPVSYDNMHDWIKQINYANYIKINTLNLPLIDMTHNYSSDSYFESNIVDFLFDPLRLKNNLDNELFINQINQINKLTLSYEKELLRNSAKTSKEEYTINDEYMFIIRDVENNSIIFIGNLK